MGLYFASQFSYCNDNTLYAYSLNCSKDGAGKCAGPSNMDIVHVRAATIVYHMDRKCSDTEVYNIFLNVFILAVIIYRHIMLSKNIVAMTLIFPIEPTKNGIKKFIREILQLAIECEMAVTLYLCVVG